MLYSNLLTLNLLVFNELYFCHVLNIKVYNMLGQMVVETAPKVSNPQVDMKELQSGVYLVTLEVEGSLQSFRVIKQ